MAVSGAPAALPPSNTGHAPAAPPVELDSVQAFSPQSLAEIPTAAVSPSVGGQDIQDVKGKQGRAIAAASAPATEADAALQPLEPGLSRNEAAPGVILPLAALEQAAPAQAPQQMADMHGQSEFIQSLQPELAIYGAYAPGPSTELSVVEMDTLSRVYKAGYQAGYEAARKSLTGHVSLAHTSPVAASPPPSNQSFKIPESLSKPLVQAPPPEAPHKPAHTEAGLPRLQEKQGRACSMLRRTVLKHYLHSPDSAMAAKPQHMRIIITHTKAPLQKARLRVRYRLQHMSKLPASRQHK